MDTEKCQEIQALIKKFQSIADNKVADVTPNIETPKRKRGFSGATVRILIGAVIGIGTGLLLTKINSGASLEIIALNNQVAAIVVFGIIGACLGINSNIFGKFSNKADLKLKESKILDRINHNQKEQNISASKNHPLISTLVYQDAINDLTSETFNQDKMLTNAEQILAMMDHTTASMH